jgi:cytochrome c-type biogenesis protein CcsB
MSSEFHGALAPQTVAGVHLRMIYQFEETAFMIPGYFPGSALTYQKTEDKEDKSAADYLEIQLSKAGETVALVLKEHNGDSEDWRYVSLNGKDYRVSFGVKSIPLNFALELTEFELERYPGSESPSSFASNLIVHDKDGHFPYRIFMNNVLDHNGFRFFQASYDTDEKGTVLSVNHDFWGTWITYIGYAMLTIFMIWSLFSPKSRFVQLRKKMQRSVSVVMLFLVLLGVATEKGNAQDAHSHGLNQLLGDAFNPQTQLEINPEIATEFGRLVVQDLDGRMKPMNTLSLELIRKLTGKTTLTVHFIDSDYSLNADQFVLSTQLAGQIWTEIPILKFNEKIKPELEQLLGRTLTSKVLTFGQLLTEDGEYVLQNRVEEASRKKPSSQNASDKEFLKLDERFNIFYGLLTGEFLRLFPHKEDPNHTWYTPHHAADAMTEEDVRFASNVLPLLAHYLQRNTDESVKQSLELIGYVHQFQQIAGKAAYPNTNRIEVELLDNKYSILSRLFNGFITVGFIWLVIAFMHVFKEFTWYKWVHTIGLAGSWILFASFTIGMLLRWYIAERPPWTDGFEMLLLASWGIVVSGLLFGRKSLFTLPLSIAFTGVLLFVAYLDWLNPEITNLVPVLKSYWLKIHVAVIVLGYAPLALSALLSLMYLILKAVDPDSSTNKIKTVMSDLSTLNEMNITIGLYLLTIGTFLGGIWANESWGRYWGWDPKETWALISIIVYTIVIHLQLIPIKNRVHWFNVAALWSFSSIIMTSFGVNYYLAGLHSYAKGDPVPIPDWVFVVVGILLVLTVVSFRKGIKEKQESQSEEKQLA